MAEPMTPVSSEAWGELAVLNERIKLLSNLEGVCTCWALNDEADRLRMAQRQLLADYVKRWFR